MATTAAGGFCFYRPNGSLITPPSPPVLGGDPVRDLREHNRREGLDITAETGRPTWAGEPMDYDLAVTALLPADG